MRAGLFDGLAQRLALNGAIILAAAIIVTFLIRRAFAGWYNARDKFLEEESKANSARRREVEPEFFYTPRLDFLPLRDNAEGEIEKRQNQVRKCAESTMVHFPKKMTNLELKTAYGVANLEKVTGYEENYNRYILSLVEWAEALLKNGDTEDAVRILEKAVELGSEFRKTYLHLADYYTGQSNADGLNYLLDKAALVFTDEGIKRQLMQYIMDKKESL